MIREAETVLGHDWPLFDGARAVHRADGNSLRESAGSRSGSLPRLQPMSAQQVALIPHCAECFELWLPGDEERWSAYLDSVLVFYCPECAEREFGDWR
jgi:hypothetical protein